MMIIRRATKKDARKISNLKRKTFEKINSKDYPKKFVKVWTKKQSPKHIFEHINNSKVFCLVEGDRLLGVVRLYDKNVIGSLYVKWNSSGNGYGRKLMDFIENYAKKEGIKKVVLYSTITASKFYEKLGYKKVKGYHNKMEKKLR
jgi:N-acetylglutamate synthase-like GNAT family acetyltransferase